MSTFDGSLWGSQEKIDVVRVRSKGLENSIYFWISIMIKFPSPLSTSSQGFYSYDTLMYTGFSSTLPTSLLSMSACAYLPSELWQTILQDAISVPVFLDADAVENISPHVITDPDLDWNDEKSYWAAERTRNSLRRVCKSWDSFLCKYEHRFVDMVDIVHHDLPVKHLESAIRVSFKSHDVSSCRKCREDFEQAFFNFNDYMQVCWLFIVQVQPIRATILDCGNSSPSFDDFDASYFPDLITLQTSDVNYFEDITEIVNKIPNLRHCFCMAVWEWRENLRIKSSSITTLSFPLRYPFPRPDWFINKNCSFPALRHLYFNEYYTMWDEEEYFCNSIEALLKIVGKELRSLYLPNNSTDYDLPKNIWDLCPKLELLHTDMPLEWAPPPEHPLHTIGLPTYRFFDNLGFSQQPELPDWPVIRTVRFDMIWSTYLYKYVQPPMHWDTTLRLEDAMGVTYDEYLEGR
jgi:hypothetical protein